MRVLTERIALVWLPESWLSATIRIPAKEEYLSCSATAKAECTVRDSCTFLIWPFPNREPQIASSNGQCRQIILHHQSSCRCVVLLEAWSRIPTDNVWQGILMFSPSLDEPITVQRVYKGLAYESLSLSKKCLRAFGQFETIQRRLAWPLH